MVRELGRGRPILVVHGGMGNEVPWLRVAKAMSTRYRVVLIRRRLYRLEIPVRLEQAIADQVAEVLDVARGFDEPCVIVGHSSGALIALEALAADSGPFAGGIIYEPPTPLPELPFGEPGLGPRARAALDAGHVGRALQIYLREGFRAPNWWSAVAPALALLPVVRQFVPRQIDDHESMVRLGVRLARCLRDYRLSPVGPRWGEEPGSLPATVRAVGRHASPSRLGHAAGGWSQCKPVAAATVG